MPGPRVAIIGTTRNETTLELVAAWADAGVDAASMDPASALEELRPGDVAVGRLDVRPTLDGVEPGLLALLELAGRGVRVLNSARALLTVHDKLRTARLLASAGLPHPASVAIRRAEQLTLEPPYVVKPRFGSWGREVTWCDSVDEVVTTLASAGEAAWFRRHGALVQAALPPVGHDLRVVVAGGRVVGCGRRVAAPGEWRTNVSLGGTLESAPVPDDAAELAVTAAAIVAADLVGVDLLPVDGGWAVLELNGAVEYDPCCALAEGDLHLDVAQALGLLRRESTRGVRRSALRTPY